MVFQQGLKWFVVSPGGRQLRDKAEPRTPPPGSNSTEITHNLHSANLRWLIKCCLMVEVSETTGKKGPFHSKQPKGKHLSFDYIYFIMIAFQMLFLH